jgi:hypothetical protein
MMKFNSEEKREGFVLGLLIASYICEERSRAKVSHDAMAIMRYRAALILAHENGLDAPVWGVRSQTIAALRPDTYYSAARALAPKQSPREEIVTSKKRFAIVPFFRNLLWGVQSYPYIRLGSQRDDQAQAVLAPSGHGEREGHLQDHKSSGQVASVILIPQTT